MAEAGQQEQIADALLGWYDRHARHLPWRISPSQRRAGRVPDFYHVWLSEVMLQQTTVAAVRSYFAAFTARWPRVEALAAADRDDVLAAWAGLGYYARARNLHKCAQVVADTCQGMFPDSEDGLRALPGVGAYTAAAIAAIAFDRPAVVVDGNVERVMARLHAIETPLPAAKPDLKALAARHTPEHRPGDYAQAVMDLGATVCTPRNPACDVCPVRPACAAARAGLAGDLPRRSARAARPTRTGLVFWAERPDGTVLLRRRPETGLLGGMMEFPTTPWLAKPTHGDHRTEVGLREAAPLAAAWQLLPGVVEHTFTHFHLELSVAIGRVEAGTMPTPCVEVAPIWAPAPDFPGLALPTVMRKVVRHVIKTRPPGCDHDGGADASTQPDQ